MTMYVSAFVTPEQVARHCADHPEFLMDLLAALAECGHPLRLAEGNSGSLHHQAVEGFLGQLADELKLQQL